MIPGLRAGFIALLLALALALALPAAVQAAEVLAVRDATLLQVGDGNRSSAVRLACIAVPADRRSEATAWLRDRLPRRSRVNLLPRGQQDGVLLARVVRLDGGVDLGEGLIAADLAQELSDCTP